MNHPTVDMLSFDRVERLVVERYRLCVSDFQPAHLIDFMHSIVTYCSAHSSKRQAVTDFPSAQFWKQTTRLANALQPAMDFYRSHCRKYSNLDATLIQVAFLIKEGTSCSDDAADTEDKFLARVRPTIKSIAENWKLLLKDEAAQPGAQSPWTTFSLMLRDLSDRTEEISIHSVHEGATELWEHVKKIKTRLSRTVMHTWNEKRSAFYTDLRNAFRSQFHETRDSYGLSSLDRLNLNVRVNLFMSHYSRITWRSHSSTNDFRGLPFYPYMAIIQSSGSGKSRLLRELGRTLPLVYANLGPDESKGYPLPNTSLRRFLLLECPSISNASTADSECCEGYYQCLLLTTTIVFYLLFSHRDDVKKRIRLPTVDTLRNKVNDTGWKTVGICEPDGKGTSSANDLFWEIVITVTRQLQIMFDGRIFGSTGATASHSQLPASKEKHDSLLQLENSLRVTGTLVDSPKGRAMERSSSSWNPESCNSHAQRLCANVSSNIPDPDEIAGQVLRYVQIRMATKKETLAEIAKTLQRVEKDRGTDKQCLYALFVALDESRCLTKHMVQNRRSVTPPQTEQDASISSFRCLRRVAHHMFDSTGVSIFLLFSDTTAKLANFTPQRALDPSARMLPDQAEEPSGQVHGPFTELGTESVGVLLLDRAVFDFRERLNAFCRTWGTPALSSEIECVSEQVTSLPFSVLTDRSSMACSSLHRLTRNAYRTHENEGSLNARRENWQDETIFRSNDDYVYLGRPLWASSMIHNEKGATWKHMVVFALQKLLGGPTQLTNDLSVYTKQCLAVIACRVPIQLNDHCGIAPQLVAEHMAWCRAVSWDRESVYLEYVNEPLLATAAAVIWEQDLAGMLRCLVARCGSYLANKGDLGEVAACILLVHAVDRAYKHQWDVVEAGCAREDETVGRTDPEVEEDSLSPAKKHYADKLRMLPKGLCMHGTVTLKEMLESSFCLNVADDYSLGSVFHLSADRTSGDGGHAWISNSSSEPVSEVVIFVPRILAEADVRFKSVKRASASVGCRDIPYLFEANVAILMQRHQRGVDILIPLRLHFPTEGEHSKTAWSCLTVQVKNRQRSPRATSVAGKHLDPIFTGAVNCDAGKESPCERCILIQKHHFGIVLNVQDGVTPDAEKRFGKVWTFLHNATKELDEIGNTELSLPRKRPRRYNGYINDVDSTPRSACLVINGVFDGSSMNYRSRLKPEILRQLERLVAQESLFGMIERKTAERTDSVNRVVTAATNHDGENYNMLIESSKLANHLVKDEEQLYARKP